MNPWDDANADDDLFEELSSEPNQTKSNNQNKSFDFITGPASANMLDNSTAMLGAQFVNTLFGKILEDTISLMSHAVQTYFIPYETNPVHNANIDVLTYLSNGNYPYILRKHFCMDAISKFRVVEKTIKNRMEECYTLLGILNDSQKLVSSELAEKYGLDKDILDTLKDIHANKVIQTSIKSAQHFIECIEFTIAVWYEEFNLILQEYENVCAVLDQEPDTVMMQTGFAESVDGSKYLENSTLQYVNEIAGQPISL